MKKTRMNTNGRLAVLTVATCFLGLPVWSASRTDEVCEQLQNGYRQESVDAGRLQKDSLRGARPFEGRGCWRMVQIGDSAYKTIKMQPPTPHYKFFGKHSALTINLLELTPENYFTFVGATGSYKEKKGQPYVKESGVNRPRQWMDANRFDDTWKDDKGISFVKTLWKTERWERCEPPVPLKKALDSYRQSRHRKDCLRGTWRLKSVRNAATGEMEPTSLHQYKFYGEDSYITFVIAPLDVENLFYTFSGNFGTFEFVNDNLIKEHGTDFHLSWTDTDHVTMTFKMNGHDWEEEWEHVRTPRHIRQIFRAMK